MLEALDQWVLAQALRRSVYVYPLVNALHILSLGVLVTSALLMDFRVLGLGRRLALDDVIGALRPVAMLALAGVVISGALLFIVQPLAYASNPVFLAKMTLLALAVANAAAFVLGRRHDMPRSVVTRVQAILSVFLWVAVLLSGRAIAFFGGD